MNASSKTEKTKNSKSDPTCAEFWEHSWEGRQADFFLKKTQNVCPERWFDFYNQVSDVYLKLWGSPGPGIADLFFAEGLIREGSSVLDVGCGPGTLTIPLAESGAAVCGLDYSPNMLNTLESEARKRGLDKVETCCCAFEDYVPESPYDMVVAAFFPPSLEPSGIARLEEWSGHHCAVVIGTGSESLPIRKMLWHELMDVPLPSGQFHLIHLTGYLLTSGRKPSLKHLSLPYCFNGSLETLVKFYKNYFAIFGRNDASAEDTIRRILEKYTAQEPAAFKGQTDVCVVWWQKKS